MLLPLANAPRDYAWGSTSLIAQLAGRAPSGRPEAEVWFGDHPADPADVDGGGTLDEITGGRLPYLLKLLAAEAPLSIQVHPTREQARAGYARERADGIPDDRRNYRDENHKPELIVALSDRFEALAGLRPLADTRRLLAALPEADGVRALRARLGSDDDDASQSQHLRDTIGWLLSGDAAEAVSSIVGVLADAPSDEFADTIAVIRRIAAQNPADPGSVVALLMNFLVLRRGEAVFLRAGLLHAYVSGLGVEIMATSDNVLRGGLTAKRIDVPELLAVADTTPGAVAVQTPAGAAWEYRVPVDDFSLRRILVDGEVSARVAGPAMTLVVSGEVRVSGRGGDEIAVAPATAVFSTAEESDLTLRGHGEVFLAQPGAR